MVFHNGTIFDHDTVFIIFDNGRLLDEYIMLLRLHTYFGLKSVLKRSHYLHVAYPQLSTHFKAQSFQKRAVAAWHSGHRVRHSNRRSRVRIPPGWRSLRLYALQCCCQNLIYIVIVCIWEKKSETYVRMYVGNLFHKMYFVLRTYIHTTYLTAEMIIWVACIGLCKQQLCVKAEGSTHYKRPQKRYRPLIRLRLDTAHQRLVRMAPINGLLSQSRKWHSQGAFCRRIPFGYFLLELT
jgi:hypothetical protein